MSILSNSGFYGFLCSAAKKAGEYVSTFVSGVSGWMIQNSGDAEFKSIYVRDKLVTNEYVYNRIRVTEDEEVLTSNGKIASAVENADGTYTIYLDLREGDLNPFCDGDLLQGYYHSPGNSGVIYSVQKMTVQEDPGGEDQSMVVQCEEGSFPHRYMVIVRVGNVFDTDRQSFIKLSSRTNCQYFFDGINSFAALDDPDHVKCVLGKADLGLFPSWAVHAIGGMKKWFGLIADGVILRGHFILESTNKSMDEEIEEISTRFEVREGEISSKIEETRRYVEEAAQSAGQAAKYADQAAEEADRAHDYTETVVTYTNEVINTADKFSQTLSQATEKAVEEAIDGVEEKVTSVVSSVVEQTAESWKATILNGQDNIISAINASTEGVSIQGNKITLTGAASFNDNVKIDTLGRIKAVNADITGKITASSGNIGELLIRDGEIVGTDSGGKTRIRVTREPLSNLSSMGGEYFETLLNKDVTNFMGGDLYITYKEVNGNPSWPSDEQVQTLSSFCSTKVFSVSAGCSTTIKWKYESDTQINVHPRGQITQVIRLSLIDANNNTVVKSYTVDPEGEITFNIDNAGRYQIRFDMTARLDYNSVIDTVSIDAYLDIRYEVSVTGEFSQQCTVIGADGFYSYWGPSDYIYARSNNGELEIKMMGNIDIRDRKNNSLLK
ncbi:MAG: hypothetical protein LUF85_03070 [Bacteroides sp.]|nr:hypothetical protein [Bacteroides sp.]